MHSFYLIAGVVTIIIRGSSASYSMAGSNGLFTHDPRMGNEETPTFVQTPVIYSAPVVPAMFAVPTSPLVHYSLNPPRSEVRNLVGSHSREEGHLPGTILDLPFRRARARKLAAHKADRKHKTLKKHRRVNKH